MLDPCKAALRIFEQIGCTVEEAAPVHPMGQLWRDFVQIRSWQTSAGLAGLYDDPAKRMLLKPEAIWEIENGLGMTARDVSRASAGRSAWYRAVRQFLDGYEYFLLPVAQVFPFDARPHWPDRVGLRPMDTYHRWMEVAAPVTMCGCPAVSVPAGFNDQGLPAGLRIVGRNQAEFSCLQLALAYDRATGWVKKRKPALLTG